MHINVIVALISRFTRICNDDQDLIYNSLIIVHQYIQRGLDLYTVVKAAEKTVSTKYFLFQNLLSQLL